MKKIIKNMLCLISVCMFSFALISCGESNNSAEESKTNTNTEKTTVVEEKPVYLNVLVNADFLDNFSVKFADKTYFNEKMSHACCDITISKKSNFTIRNTFKLTLQVSKYIDLGGGGFTFKYIDTAFSINESSFTDGKCLINCPVNEHGQFNFNKSEYKKMIGVTSLG